MNREKMWVYMIQLGANMWGRPEEQRPYYIEEEDCYKEYMSTDREVWRKVTDFLPTCGFNTLLIDIGEGIRFDSHPELAVSGSWSKEEMREELARLRSIGLTPLPKLNFSTCHNAWMGEYAYMVGTETYYRVCQELIEETIELFDTPEFFHLGLDEERFNKVEGYPIATVRAPYKQVEDANKLFKVCLDKGVRPWMWIDSRCIHNFGGDDYFRKHIPKEVVISNWFYRNMYSPEYSERIELYKKLGEWGYEQIPTSSTFSYRSNSRQTMRYCKENVNSDSLIGFMTASWILTDWEDYYGLLNDAWRFGYAREVIYGEKMPARPKDNIPLGLGKPATID